MKPVLKYFLMIGLLAFVSDAKAQAEIHWVEFSDAVRQARLENKKIMVDIYTQWCGWCRVMDQKTFHHEDVANYVNDRYVAVKFDAEFTGDIEFNGRTYSYVRKGKKGYHELAAELMRGRLSYPTIVFLDEELNVIQPIPGYQNPVDFQMILMYFADNYFRRIPWDKFTFQYRNQRIGQPVNGNNR
ncbi:MAG: DUF255 domain-containing protein [Saprospiraceae bacterium]|nr:DUF255 domain-containing protein [Saprospiraceae bacterium]